MRYFFGTAIAGLILILIVKTVNLNEVVSALELFPKIFILPLIFLSMAILVLKTWRLSILLRSNEIPIRFWQTFKVLVAGNTLSSLPGGEMFRSVLLSYETGKPMHRTGSAVLAQTFLEVFTAVLIFSAGAVVYHDFLLPGFVVLVLTILFFALVSHRGLLEFVMAILPEWKLIQRAYRFVRKIRSDYARILFTRGRFLNVKIIFEKGDRRWWKRIMSLRLAWKMGVNKYLPSPALWQVLGISISGHLLGGGLLWLITYTLNSPLSPVDTFFVYSVGIVISTFGAVLPGGVGITEGGMVSVLLVFGTGFPQALAIVLIFRTITLLLNILYGLVFMLIFYLRPLLLERKAI